MNVGGFIPITSRCFMRRAACGEGLTLSYVDRYHFDAVDRSRTGLIW
jgi:hypothetical protein